MNELTIELNVLFWSAILYLLHILVAAVGADANNGIAWALGNHDTQPELPEWVNRARRAQANLAENLLPFACLILVAHQSGHILAEGNHTGAGQCSNIDNNIAALFYGIVQAVT